MKMGSRKDMVSFSVAAGLNTCLNLSRAQRRVDGHFRSNRNSLEVQHAFVRKMESYSLTDPKSLSVIAR